MKQWLFSLGIAAAFAGESIACKVELKSGNGYVALSDNTLWKVIPYSTRWRSLSEWWNGVELAPEHYKSSITEWTLGTEVAITPKSGDLEAKESDASNQSDLRQCTHMFRNERTGHVLFAIAMQPVEFMTTLHKEVYSDGHAAGYAKGYGEGATLGRRDSAQARKEGFKEGYAKGYEKGLYDGRNEQPPAYTPSAPPKQ